MAARKSSPAAAARPVPAPGAACPRLPDQMLDAVAAKFRALSQAPRLRLLEALFDGPRSVGDLADASGLSQANASKHLAVLAQSGFIQRRREGTSVVYEMADPLPRQLCSLMCGRVVSEVEAGLKKLRPADGGH